MIDYFITIFVLFVLGLIAGSFLNVVILRFNSGRSILRGRSMCFSCGKTLTWSELIPLGSFIFQGGRCRACKSKISWQYPLIELLGGLSFVLAYVSAPWFWPGVLPWIVFLLTAILFCLYIVIFVYDIKHKIIPDAFSYTAAVISLLFIGLEWMFFGSIDPTKIIAGPLLFLFFYIFWKLSKGKWMGLGDGKLALSIGWALGFSQGIAVLLLSFWIGAITALFMMIFSRKTHMRSEIPFAPFLILAFVICFVFGINMDTILSYLAV